MEEPKHFQTRGGPDKVENVLKSAGYNTDFLHPKASPKFYEAWTTPPTNYIGTAFFLSYITAALYLTWFIIFKDIRPRWSSKQSDSRSIRSLLVLGVLSFSALSANMMLFLVDSFTSYVEGEGLKLSVPLLWPWMLETSLFFNFTRALLKDSSVMYWTQQALTTASLMAFDMSYRGKKHNVQTLWAYFLLAQILPPSFAWILLRLRIASASASVPDQDGKTSASRTVELEEGFMKAFFGLFVITITMSAIHQLGDVEPLSPRQILWKIFQLRVHLLMPFLLPPSEFIQRNVTPLYSGCAFLVLLGTPIFDTALTALMNSSLTWINIYSTCIDFFQAGFSNWAISALSCDWVIWLVETIILRSAR